MTLQLSCDLHAYISNISKINSKHLLAKTSYDYSMLSVSFCWKLVKILRKEAVIEVRITK